ncbi:MAG: 8-amino-7-oxononanoate synthase [Candidatus Hydrogenedentota bacterium]
MQKVYILLTESLKNREKQGLLRKLYPIKERRGCKIIVNNKEYIDFSSNDYLGLSNHPQIINAAKEAVNRYGTGACASRLLSGSFEIHHKLEEEVARFKQKEKALIFNSGYQANLGILSALLSRDDCVFSDRLNHASIIDGIILSQAKIIRFKHNDTDNLKSLLEKQRKKYKKALIITETIFSMDGDRAPLKELIELKKRYDCIIMVDEAHATGIFGENGSGIVEQEGISDEIDIIMGTFSKALGCFGAYCTSDKKMIEYLINTARSFIYSTSLPPAVIASNLKAIEIIRNEKFRRETLLKNSEFFKDNLKDLGLKVRGSSQIIPLIIGDNNKTIKIAARLQRQGYFVLPIRYPTVPKNESRLRFSMTFNHSKEVIINLLDSLRKFV